MYGPFSRLPFSRRFSSGKYIAIIRFEPFGEPGIQAHAGGAISEIEFAPFGEGIFIDGRGGGIAVIAFDPFGAGRKLTEDLYFIDEPLIRTQGIIATHVWVVSPTAEYLAYIPGTPDENKIEKLVPIEVGNRETCRIVAERLLEKYGREQKSVAGKVDLVVTTKFKEKLRVWIPSANIDEYMVLQSKEHDLDQRTTVLTLGDIMLNEDEWLARILQEI